MGLNKPEIHYWFRHKMRVLFENKTQFLFAAHMSRLQLAESIMLHTYMCALRRSKWLYILTLWWWFGTTMCALSRSGQLTNSSPLVVVWQESMWSTTVCALSRSGRLYISALWWWFGKRACMHIHVCFEQVGRLLFYPSGGDLAAKQLVCKAMSCPF